MAGKSGARRALSILWLSRLTGSDHDEMTDCLGLRRSALNRKSRLPDVSLTRLMAFAKVTACA